MTAVLYAKGREGFLAGDIDWDGNTINVDLTDHGLGSPPNTTTDDNLDDISAESVQTCDAPIGSKTTTNGVADGGDLTFTAVPAGGAIESFSSYKDTGTPSTSRLIHYDDAATGLPVTPNGGDITITWDNGASKIFVL
jgi:hypothetical protein